MLSPVAVDANIIIIIVISL